MNINSAPIHFGTIITTKRPVLFIHSPGKNLTFATEQDMLDRIKEEQETSSAEVRRLSMTLYDPLPPNQVDYVEQEKQLGSEHRPAVTHQLEDINLEKLGKRLELKA